MVPSFTEQARANSNGSDGTAREDHFDPKVKRAALEQQKQKDAQRRRDTMANRKKAEQKTQSQ